MVLWGNWKRGKTSKEKDQLKRDKKAKKCKQLPGTTIEKLNKAIISSFRDHKVFGKRKIGRTTL